MKIELRQYVIKYIYIGCVHKSYNYADTTVEILASTLSIFIKRPTRLLSNAPDFHHACKSLSKSIYLSPWITEISGSQSTAVRATNRIVSKEKSNQLNLSF